MEFGRGNIKCSFVLSVDCPPFIWSVSMITIGCEISENPFLIFLCINEVALIRGSVPNDNTRRDRDDLLGHIV